MNFIGSRFKEQVVDIRFAWVQLCCGVIVQSAATEIDLQQKSPVALTQKLAAHRRRGARAEGRRALKAHAEEKLARSLGQVQAPRRPIVAHGGVEDARLGADDRGGRADSATGAGGVEAVVEACRGEE